MKITELTGRNVKKFIKAKSCFFRYHNKRDHGGSFGFEIRGLDGRNHELSGCYTKFGDEPMTDNIYCMNGLIRGLDLHIDYKYPTIPLITENIIDCRGITLEIILKRMQEAINQTAAVNV